MTQINFDPNQPLYRSKLTSEFLRENFQALSRANDLRATEQDPPDLTVKVEPGSYALTSESTLRYAGGSSDPLDTTTGGSSTQRRIFVLELDDAGVLHWNSNSSWVTPPLDPVAPAYNASRIPLCEVTVTYGDTIIIQDQVADARPMINLGVGIGQALSPGSVTLVASPGQIDFDTSAHFTFMPEDILVWSTPPGLSPGPSTGLFFRVYGVDYTELNDTTIRFISPPYNFLGGELIVIWKVGLSATPGTFALADLSDVDGDQSAAFHAADVPDAGNPFLTESGHNSIDHLTDVPSLVPVAAHLVTTATNPAMRHHASEIEATDNFTFSNETNVQGVLDDVSDIIYDKYRAEHYATGVHGPKVTVEQTSNDNALVVTKGTGAADTVVITNSGSGTGILVQQVGSGLGASIQKSASGTALHIKHSSTAEGTAVHIEKYSTGSYATVQIDNSGIGESLLIKQTGAGKGLRIMQSGSENAVVVEKYATGSNSAVLVTNSGTGAGLYVVQSGIGRAVRVDQDANDIALYLNKAATSSGNVIEIFNGGTGYDIQGHNNNWNIDKNGNGNFRGPQSIFTFTWANASTAFSTGALGFTPRYAIAVTAGNYPANTQYHFSSNGYATGTGTNAKSTAANDRTNNDDYCLSTVDDQSISGFGQAAAGTTYQTAHAVRFVVQAWSASNITIQPILVSSGLPVNMNAVMHLIVMG